MVSLPFFSPSSNQDSDVFYRSPLIRSSSPWERARGTLVAAPVCLVPAAPPRQQPTKSAALALPCSTPVRAWLPSPLTHASFFVLCVCVAKIVLQLAFCSFTSVCGLRAWQVFDKISTSHFSTEAGRQQHGTAQHRTAPSPPSRSPLWFSPGRQHLLHRHHTAVRCCPLHLDSYNTADKLSTCPCVFQLYHFHTTLFKLS
jgi:hypothetical protein